MDTKNLERLDYNDPTASKATPPTNHQPTSSIGSPPTNSNRNKNTMIIAAVQGLVAQISKKLLGEGTEEEPGIKAETTRQKTAKAIAIDEIDTYEKITLNELQVSFE